MSFLKLKTLRPLSAWRGRLCLLLVLIVPGPGQAETLRFATWNIENFWHVAGESLRGPYRGRDTIRSQADYAAIRAVIDRLDAHVWALQEMGSPAAVRALFPAADWALVFSSRYDPTAPPDIYTALVVARDFGTVQAQDPINLNFRQTDRLGTAARLQVAGTTLWVASVHLKSGCRSDTLGESGRPACEIMAAQIPVLEAWVDSRLDQGVLVGGDFNRTLMRQRGGSDPVWQNLADGMPERLLAFPFADKVNCPEGRYGDRTWPVDFILTNPALAMRAGPGPYVQSMGGQALSDHCPVVVEFALP